MSTDPVIVTSGLTKNFDSVRAVDEVSFEVEQGTIFGYLGPNGSGKSTTINMLLGLIPPSSGSGSVLGFDVHSEGQEIREQAGALLEHGGIYEQMTAEDNLECFGRAAGMSSGDRASRSKDLLTSMELWDRRTERASTWSRGMRQQLAIARAVIHRPAMLFLDEPTAGLDVVAANRVRSSIEQMTRGEGVSVFLTTHNLAEAERLCDQITVIRDGKVISSGSPDDLRQKASQPTLRVNGTGFSESVVSDLNNRSDVAEIEQDSEGVTLLVTDSIDQSSIVEQLVGAGVRVREVRHDDASLEDAFLKLLDGNEDG